ncbi:hypothetical protein BC833DRAFT_225359 [Globomyces pollinis-pini]|nr:hypothetical protein BC833DRAFT_225359 [Globomyces pollinis-pini]
MATTVNIQEPLKLEILDQANRARCCGSGNYDFRSINPVTKLKHSSESPIFDGHFLVTATLYSIEPDGQLQKKSRNNLIGNTIAESRNLNDLTGSRGIFFVFPNLYIRRPGSYKILYQLISIFGPNGTSMIPESTVIDSVFSDTVSAYAPRYYPGKSKVSMLLRFLAKQTPDLKTRNL